ncbi:MAG: ABC transporter permease [SAR324 cluster bacterium]|nr:ABC transporter permease [SAR324 cluster bacterium]
MKRFIVVRIVQMFVTLILLSVLIFSLIRISGDPAALLLDESATEKDYQLLRVELGLDEPIIAQYFKFISRAAVGDFGLSTNDRVPVLISIGGALPNTARLALTSLVLALSMAVPLGVISAVKKGSVYDHFARVIAGLGQSVPTFWVGLVLIQIFAVNFRILPSSGMETSAHYILPSATLALFMMSGFARLLRSSMLEVLDSEFIKLARIKGVSESSVVWKHALRNSLMSVLSFGGMYIAILMTGTILVETVFAWPGLGRLAYEGIINQDFPLIQGVVLIGGVIVMLSSLLTDILYAYLDPRIRFSG